MYTSHLTGPKLLLNNIITRVLIERYAGRPDGYRDRGGTYYASELATKGLIY